MHTANSKWRKATDPPSTRQDNWSEQVIAISTYLDVYYIAYFGSPEDGMWQRPQRMKPDEKIVLWIPVPVNLIKEWEKEL